MHSTRSKTMYIRTGTEDTDPENEDEEETKQTDIILRTRSTNAIVDIESIAISPIIICGPPGVGKGVLINRIKELIPNTFGVAISYTTRKARPGEIADVTYHYITKDEFETGIKKNNFIEYVQKNGNYYGIGIKSIQNISNQNLICIIEIDVEGAKHIKKSGKLSGAKYIFITCDGEQETIRKRLKARNMNTEKEIEDRVKRGIDEFQFLRDNLTKNFFDFVISNNIFEKTAQKLALQFKNWYPYIKFTPKTRDDVTGRLKFTKQKIACWMSMQIHLIDIAMAAEDFEVHAAMNIFFQDPDLEFQGQLDEDILLQIRKQGYIDYSDLSVSFRKKLPVKASFLLNAIEFELIDPYLELYDEKSNVWNFMFSFNARCAEHMELEEFPFDGQFLNLQMSYRIQDYKFLSKCPEWIHDDARSKHYHTDKPINLSVKDAIKTQWKVEKPWIDLRLDRGKEYDFHFSVIRLRVKREPTYYLINTVLPIFLVLCCSFASFIMPIDEYLNDKLAYIITLLLTLTAFQYTVNGELPKSTEITMIDAYILYAYGILTFFTFEISVIYVLISNGYNEIAEVIDVFTFFVFGLLWLRQSWKFLYGYLKSRRNDVDWRKKGELEMKAWSNGYGLYGASSMEVDDAEFYGTEDK